MNLTHELIQEVSPPKKNPLGVWVGLHWTAVSSRYTGMAHTYKSSNNLSISGGGKLSSQPLHKLCQMALSANTLEASVGFAAINSLLRPCGLPGNVETLFKRMSRNRNVSIIGRFPFNDSIKKIAKKCYIFEITPAPGEYSSQDEEEILPRCQLNIITATALINHTLEHLLELGCGGKNIVLGPTTPFSQILFSRGADILAGVEVTDRNRLVRTITQGVKKFNDIGGIKPLYLKK